MVFVTWTTVDTLFCTPYDLSPRSPMKTSFEGLGIDLGSNLVNL